MNLIYTKSFDSSVKKLKNYKEELWLLEEILDTIKSFDSFDLMIHDPILHMYHFERLKYDLSDFYSFRLSKVIRLIIRSVSSGVEVDLIYISMDHYNDFSLKKVIYYDE